MEELFTEMAKELIAGNEARVKNLTQQVLDKGASARQVLDNGLLAGMDIVGKRFKAGDMFIPEVLLCARTMHGAMDILKPLLSDKDAAGAGKVIIGTVEGDLHDIGKNLVAMLLQGAGFKVIDIGTNISPQAFVDAVKEHQPQIIGMSALLTTTMPKMEETIKALKEAGIRDQVKIMAGGAPVTQDFVDKIGADAYGANAAAASEKAKALLS
ncbi:MAG: cobalamin-binding protein [Deltaproteobacteria bacterium]|nr:MAG: cobalamin-binding protein [Deltaproteobacteria bacterium]RLC19212.1 MAG: cobalamin-binding protein [Deltaproteobacteria bacterium]